MDRKDKGKQPLSDPGLESCTKEKMKRSVMGSCKAEVESVAGEENPSPKLSTCDICFRSFNCGKALGGHRRSHFMKQQKKVKTRLTDNNHSSKPGDNNNIRVICDFDADDGKHICCICNKEFPTKNALFGHMRSHPERPWRGVSPPTQKNSSSPPSSSYYCSPSSSLNSDSTEKDKEDHDGEDGCDGAERVIASAEQDHKDCIDLLMLISPSWLCKDVRGRSSIGGYQAAETLFCMSSYSKYFSTERNRVFPNKDEVLPKSAPALIKQRKRNICESSSSKKDDMKRFKFCIKGELKLGSTSDGVGESDGEGNELNRSKGLAESGVKYKHGEKKKGTMAEGFDDLNAELGTPTKEQDHAGPSDVKKNMDKKGKSKKSVLNSRTKEPESERASEERADGYKCAACGKSFKTFQGLGGHRSIHKEKNIALTIDEPKPLEAVAEQANSSSSSNINKTEEEPLLFTEETLADQPCQSSGVKKLSFDLNELPCAMDED